MRVSQYLIATLKETPADADIVSHQLMVRAGLIRKLATGLYSWLPLGFRVLSKVTQIIREEMDKSGAMEVTMPVVQPSELWKESGRWQSMGAELLRLKDRHERDFCLGPTHEEVITDIVRNEISSYRQLPTNLYQIQTKFRDERRPRFGIMRSREFIMKDAYSFHIDRKSLEETYQLMHQTYCEIFTRLGLHFRSVKADSGNIGGSTSHEFHVLADSGEDEIVFSSDSTYAANLELAEGILITNNRDEDPAEAQIVETGNATTIQEVEKLLEVESVKILKTLLVYACDKSGKANGELVALLLRGDQELNETKATKISGVASPLKFADDEMIKKTVGCPPGCIGPQDLTIRKIADHSVIDLKNFICGANVEGQHVVNQNWSEQCTYSEVADLRKIQEGDLSPDGKGTLSIKRGIEVGHIFQLGKKYSEALKATVLDKSGKAVAMSMGCYGIGVTRIIAACIEQSHDTKGIIWPKAITPFQLIIVQIDAHKSESVRNFSENIYCELLALGIEVLLDDRDKKTSPGVKLAESELIGIPHRVVVSPRFLADGVVEYTNRKSGEKQSINKDVIIKFLRSAINAQADH